MTRPCEHHLGWYPDHFDPDDKPPPPCTAEATHTTCDPPRAVCEAHRCRCSRPLTVLSARDTDAFAAALTVDVPNAALRDAVARRPLLVTLLGPAPPEEALPPVEPEPPSTIPDGIYRSVP
jgi:hypothetical protein